MAVSVEQLAAALNLTDENASLDSATTTRLSGLLAVATARVEKAAPLAPEAVRDEGIIRMCGFLHDRPGWSESGLGPASAYLSSGAAALLKPWRVRRALHIGD